MSVLVAANAVVVVGLWWRQGGIREIHDARRAADEPRARHRAARRLPGARRAPAAGAHPGARRGRARAHERVAPAQRDRVPGAARRPHGAHHGRLRARRRRLADARDRRPAHALLGCPAGHHRARPARRRRRQLGRGGPPPALLPRVARAARLAPTSRSRWASAISSPPAASSRASRSPARTGGRSTRVALGALVGLRLVLPVARSLRHRLRIERVVPEAPGIVSLEIGGVGLERLPVPRGPVAALALPRARALVGDASVLAVGRARRAAAAHHGQGRRRLHAPARVAAGRDARDRRGAVGRADERGAPAPAGRADRGRRGHRADPRAARGHAGRAGHDRRHLPRGAARTTSSSATSSTSSRGGAAPSCTTSWASAAATSCCRPSTCRRWCPTSPAATSTSAGRRG